MQSRQVRQVARRQEGVTETSRTISWTPNDLDEVQLHLFVWYSRLNGSMRCNGIFYNNRLESNRLSQVRTLS